MFLFMGDFKEHGLMLYLGSDLYLGFIQYQADNKLGRSYAGLSIFNEGAYHLGLISEEQYQVNKTRYSRALIDQQNKPLTLEQLNSQKELERWTRTFSLVLNQWAEHKDKKWREGWISKADLWKDRIKTARLVLELANND